MLREALSRLQQLVAASSWLLLLVKRVGLELASAMIAVELSP